MADGSDTKEYGVSVVLPAFNSESTIRRSIDSVLRQTRPADEIVVVDDGSTDGSADVIKSYGDKVRYVYQENSSCAGARNSGIKAAKYRWIALQDADDEWLEDKLELQMKVLEENPDLLWCGANSYNSLGTKKSFRCPPEKAKQALGGKDYFDNYLAEAAKRSFHNCAVTMVIRRDIFDEVGLFAEDLRRPEDIDMWSRIAFKYPKMGYVTQATAIVHLDLVHAEQDKLRIESKRGVDERKMVERNLQRAKEYGQLRNFKPFASMYLKERLKEMIFHGHKSDVRDTVMKFGELFPLYWRVGAYVLTIFPKLSIALINAGAYIAHLIGLEKRVTRRWQTKKVK